VHEEGARGRVFANEHLVPDAAQQDEGPRDIRLQLGFREWPRCVVLVFDFDQSVSPVGRRAAGPGTREHIEARWNSCVGDRRGKRCRGVTQIDDRDGVPAAQSRRENGAGKAGADNDDPRFGRASHGRAMESLIANALGNRWMHVGAGRHPNMSMSLRLTQGVCASASRRCHLTFQASRSPPPVTAV